MKFYRPGTQSVLTELFNDIEDFKPPFEIYSEWEEALWLDRYNRLTNALTSILERPVIGTRVNGFVEGND